LISETRKHRDTNETMSGNENSLADKRVTVIEEVEQLCQRVKTEMGADPRHVRKPLNNARENLLDEGEYNYLVRTALVQLEHVVSDAEVDLTATRECIQKLNEQLSDKAALPPHDQLRR